MHMKYIQKISFWVVFTLPSIVLGGSTKVVPAVQSLSGDITISDIILVVTLIAGLLTIISVARGGQSKKAIIDDDEFIILRNEMHDEYNDLKHELAELTKLDAGTKIYNLQNNLAELDDIVRNTLKKKIYSLSEHFTTLENRVLDLDKHFDRSNLDRKEDNRQIKNEINTLRENIREDINDVKDIIMKLMMALKTADE